jgi:uncharacterized protein YfcZ (UPF0381/DUF406 family)
MKLQFTVSDELFEYFVKKFGIPGCYNRMRKLLEEMKDVDPNDRYIILSGDARRSIEAIFQTTLDTPEKLAKLTEHLNKVEIGGIAIDFTIEELQRIDMQAGFHGKSRKDFVQWMANDLKNAMLDQI